MTIHITLPPYKYKFERWETVNYRHDIKNTIKDRGVYVIFGELGEVLYVGKSRRLFSRLRQHIAKAEFAYEIASIAIIEVDALIHLDLYETHAINVLRPKYNRDKVYRLSPERKYELISGLTDVLDDIEMYRDQIYELSQEEACSLRDADIAIAREGLTVSLRERNRINAILDAY